MLRELQKTNRKTAAFKRMGNSAGPPSILLSILCIRRPSLQLYLMQGQVKNVVLSSAQSYADLGEYKNGASTSPCLHLLQLCAAASESSSVCLKAALQSTQGWQGLHSRGKAGRCCSGQVAV